MNEPKIISLSCAFLLPPLQAKASSGLEADEMALYDLAHEWARSGNLAGLRLFHKINIDLDLHGSYNEGPVMAAARYGQAEALKVLAEIGADLIWVNDDDHASNTITPIMAAAKNGDAAVLKVFQEYGAPFDTVFRRTGETALTLAVRGGHVEAAKIILQNEVDRNQVNRLGLSAADIALVKRDMVMLHALDEAGVDLSYRKLLMIAIKSYQPEAVKIFIRQGANLSDREKGQTPLTFAARYGDAKSFQILLDAGASLEATNDEGDMPKDIAFQAGRKEILDIIEVAELAKADASLGSVSMQPWVLNLIFDEAQAYELQQAAAQRPSDDTSLPSAQTQLLARRL